MGCRPGARATGASNRHDAFDLLPKRAELPRARRRWRRRPDVLAIHSASIGWVEDAGCEGAACRSRRLLVADWPRKHGDQRPMELVAVKPILRLTFLSHR